MKNLFVWKIKSNLVKFININSNKIIMNLLMDLIILESKRKKSKLIVFAFLKSQASNLLEKNFGQTDLIKIYNFTKNILLGI